MLTRFATLGLLLLISLYSHMAIAASCSAVFPAGLQSNQLGTGNELTNFPVNNSTNNLTAGTVLSRGDNFYAGSALGNQDSVSVGGITGSDTTARLYFSSSVSWQNVKINEFGNPEDLIIIVDGALHLTGGNTVINAIIYVKGASDSSTITGNITINGSFTDLGATSITHTIINYQSSYINNADFNGMCSGVFPALPLANYQFDECAYSGSGNEVLDQTTNYSGTSHGGVDTNGVSKIGRALNLLDYSDHVETSVPLPASYSVSAWFKKPTSTTNSQYFGLGAIATGGDLLYLDRLNGWKWGVYNGTSSIDGSYSFASLDSNWHYLTLVYQSNVTKLYIDGVYTDSVNTAPSGTLKYIGTSFDDVNTTNAQGFRAPLDEFIVYDNALLPTQIQSIYNSQNVGNNHDGSQRTITSCATLITNFRLDECAYNGTTNEVVDQLGTNAATSFGGVDTFATGKIERASNFTNLSHHLETSIPLSTKYSISTWFKKPTSTTDSRYFIVGSMQAGGDLLYLDRNNSWRWGVYSLSPNGSTLGTYSFSALDSNWHHLSLVYESGVTKLYIDGSFVDSVNRAPAGTLKYIGTSFDSVGTTNAQGFRAPLDEFMVFSGTLSPAEITNIYTNQLAGNNYDGTTRAAVSCLNLVAHYQMDEASWGSVIDSVNGFNGTAFNGANTVGTACRYGSFDGIDDYIEIPHNAALNGSNALTYSAFIRADTWTGIDQIMAKSVHGGGSGRAQMGIFSENGVFKVRAETVSGRKEISDTLPVAAGDWVHVAAVFNDTSLILYIDGVNVASTTFSSTTLVQTTDPLNISKRVGTDVYYFDGLIDDIRVYTSALTAQQVNDIINTTTLCSLTAVDHFQIEHDGNGLTCDAETVTIKACADASCTVLSNDAVTLNLLGNGNAAPLGSPTFTGSTTVNFNHTIAETLTLSVANPTITPTNNFICKNGASSSCNILFADAGFRFLYGAAESTTIANQVAGNPLADILKIQAVENINGVCTGLFTGNVNVDLAQKNTSPTGTGGLNFTVNNAIIAKHPTFTSTMLNFGANSKATITNPVYNDAGQIQLYARYNSGGVNLVGNSNAFWVSPEKLVVSAKNGTTTLNATTVNGVTGQPLQKAGANFDLQVTAVNAAGATTPNYFPTQMQFKLQRTGPTVNGVDGNLTYVAGGSLSSALSPIYQNVTLNSFINGVSTYSGANYSEVGLLNLDLKDNNYGGAGIVVNGDAINVGRFIPDHFVQTVVTQGTLTGTCGTGSWVYTGQKDEATQREGAISYGTAPTLRITAYNANGSTASDITKNYSNQSTTPSGESFMRLLNTGISMTTPTTDLNQAGVTTTTTLTGTIDAGKLVQSSAGVLDYTLAATDDFTYTHEENAKINPYQAEIPLAVSSITDQDGVTATATEQAVPTGVEIRFGRMALANSFGPETANLAQPLSTEYWNNDNFVINTDDKCSGFDSSKVSLSNISLVPNGLAAVVSGLFVNGTDSTIELKATGAGNQGQIGVSYSAFPWLQYDWKVDGTYIDPEAIATFGLFRGNDRVIYWREVNN